MVSGRGFAPADAPDDVPDDDPDGGYGGSGMPGALGGLWPIDIFCLLEQPRISFFAFFC